MKQKASTKSDDSKKAVPRVSIAPGNLAGVNNCCHTIQPHLPAQDKHVLRNPIIQPIFWGHYYVNNPSEVTNLTNLITDLVTGRFMNGLAQYGVVRGTVYGQQTVDIPPPNQGPAITSTVSPSHGGSDPVPGQISSWITKYANTTPTRGLSIFITHTLSPFALLCQS